MKKGILEERLITKGFKLTNQRRVILRIFEESEKHLLTAQEVLEKVGSGTDRMNFSTVYRNLEMLTKIDVLNKVLLGQGISGFELKHHDHHHHHLICKACGKTTSINFCPFEAIGPEVMEDFVPIEHKFEIYGFCKGCKR